MSVFNTNRTEITEVEAHGWQEQEQPPSSILEGRKLAHGASMLTACARAAQPKSKHVLKKRDLMPAFLMSWLAVEVNKYPDWKLISWYNYVLRDFTGFLGVWLILHKVLTPGSTLWLRQHYVCSAHTNDLACSHTILTYYHLLKLTC